ncbi:MAG: ABC transporter ATP-binding protein [Corynebacterium matruchotii]
MFLKHRIQVLQGHALPGPRRQSITLAGIPLVGNLPGNPVILYQQQIVGGARNPRRFAYCAARSGFPTLNPGPHPTKRSTHNCARRRRPTLTAAENITLPMNIAGKRVDKKWYREVTTRLGLAERLKHRPAELSGGQQQRVACARALVARPEIIFGDEPTGNLDSNSSAEVLDILRTAVDVYDQTVVIVTHDPTAASYADRVVFLADGKIVRALSSPTVEQILWVMGQLETRG